MKRKIAMILTLTLSASMFMMTGAFAAEIPEELVTKTVSGAETDSGFSYRELENGTLSVSYSGNETEIVIPETHDGKLVSAIYRNGFWNCTNLERISLPDSMTEIGDYAFMGCTSLQEIKVPDSVTKIGNSAFQYCTSLKNIQLSDCITTIGGGAFYESGLTSITLPAKLICLESSTFERCNSLTTVIIPKSVTKIASNVFKDCNILSTVFYSGTKEEWNNVTIMENNGWLNNVVIRCTDGDVEQTEEVYTNITEGDYTYQILKDGTVAITNYSGTALDLTVADTLGGKTVTKLAQGSFRNDTLVNVTIPEGIVEIDSAFYCPNLETIKIPASAKTMKSAFSNCYALKEAVIPEGITKLGDACFMVCYNLEKVTLPDSLTEIGSGVFASCSNLKDIELPDNITTIGSGAFNLSGLTSIILPAGLSCVEERTFSSCSHLTSATIPTGVKTISESAFDGCNTLTDIYYLGSKAEWNEIQIASGNDALTQATIHYAVDDSMSDGPEDPSNDNPEDDTSDDQSTDDSATNLPAQDPDAIPDGPTTWVGQTGTEGFVNRLYNVALTRDSETEGFNDWNQKLKSKTSTAVEVAQGFIFSQEFKNKEYNDVQFVKILYRTMFGREADEGGLADWLDALENGMSREYVYHGFAESQEFTNLCEDYDVVRGEVSLSAYRDKNKGATGFIARLYTKMLGRKFEDDGIEYWCEEYLTGRRSIESIATDGFLHSEEFTNQNLSNEEFVTRMYETFLNREPEEAGLKDWVNRLETGEVTRDSLVYGFTNSVEFANLKALYQLP